MMKLAKLSALAVILMVAGQMDAKAQTFFELGPRIGYEIDNVQTAKIGADMRISTAALPVVLNPTFDFYLSDSGSPFPGDDVEGVYENMLQFTLNGLYEFGVDNQMFTPYFGPGISILHTTFPEADGRTELGLNLTGGFSFMIMQTIRPFIQGEFAVGGDIEPASVTAGVMFSLN